MESLKTIFPGVFRFENKLWTQNRVAGQRVYGEPLKVIDGIEYRSWTPHKSKLAAGIQNGLKNFPIKPDSKVLYLGSAEGTTVSHLSDILQTGFLVGLDASARVMPKFISLCQTRPNLIPLLADANKPLEYPPEIQRIAFDVQVQDISQKNQAEIFLKNSTLLKKGGHGLLVIKAPSIDSSQRAQRVVESQTKELKPGFNLIQTVSLEPFETAHTLVHAVKKTF